MTNTVGFDLWFDIVHDDDDLLCHDLHDMNTYNPRDSVLYLFDPLATPDSKTPPRNTGSPESLQASDKENDGPAPGEVTAFFNRVYKLPNALKSPKGKLIDFGETNVEQEDFEDDIENDENGYDLPPSPSLHRRPLADIEIERAPPHGVSVPPTIREEQDQPGLSPSEPENVHSRSGVSVAPSGAPLANVINSINLSAMSIMASSTISERHGAADASNCPNITVYPPDMESESPASREPESCSRQGPYLSPEAIPVVYPLTRRPNPSTSAFDPRRTSVDLQSSFSMHLQSSEMSFDLLNDKISFLSNHSESFWPGMSDIDLEEDTFDLAKEQMKMEEIAKKYGSRSIDEDTFDMTKEKQKMEALVRKYGSIQEQSLETVVEEMPRVKELTPPKPRPTIQRTLEDKPPVFSLPSSEPVVQPPAAPSKAPRKERQALGPSVAPLPALNIIKKSFKLTHDRTSSTSSSASTFSTVSRPASSTSSHTDAEDAAPEVVPRRRPSLVGRPPVRGIQRPPPGSVVPPVSTRTTGSVRSAMSSKRPELPTKAEPVRSSMRTTTSAPTTRASSLQRPSVPSATSSLSHPSIVSSTSQPKPSALRPPTARLPSTSSSSTGVTRSALPRPASRLPGPSKSSTTNIARRL